MKRWLVLGILVGGYIVTAFCVWLAETRHEIPLLMSMLSPIGWILTGYALVLGVRNRHADATRAHLDRLGHAYASWLERTWKQTSVAGEHAARAREAANVHPDRTPESTQHLAKVYDVEDELRTAATTLMMFEDDSSRRVALDKTCASLSSWEGTMTDERRAEYRAFLAELQGALISRLDDIKALFDGAVQSIADARGKLP